MVALSHIFDALIWKVWNFRISPLIGLESYLKGLLGLSARTLVMAEMMSARLWQRKFVCFSCKQTTTESNFQGLKSLRQEQRSNSI